VLLFLYGTLMEGRGNSIAERLHARLYPGLPAYATGHLYAIRDPEGWYPAFVPDPAGVKVVGMVHETTSDFDAACLAVLDAYEDYDPACPEQSLFIRQLISVCLREAGQWVEAQAYVWAQPVAVNQIEIADGDFRGFLRERGETAFAAQFHDDPQH
jgi:gamma-glutamylcyclotransferase (GGCT)/AIG2-like uncharacterized protein YtfP